MQWLLLLKAEAEAHPLHLEFLATPNKTDFGIFANVICSRQGKGRAEELGSKLELLPHYQCWCIHMGDLGLVTRPWRGSRGALILPCHQLSKQDGREQMWEWGPSLCLEVSPHEETASAECPPFPWYSEALGSVGRKKHPSPSPFPAGSMEEAWQGLFWQAPTAISQQTFSLKQSWSTAPIGASWLGALTLLKQLSMSGQSLPVLQRTGGVFLPTLSRASTFLAARALLW